MIRPAGGALTFVCVRCELVLDDGVDYAWCPRCSRAVDWLDPALTVWVCRICDVLVAAAEPEECRCGRQLRRLSQPSTSVPPTRSPVAFATARRIYLAMLAIWVAAAFVDPRNEPLMRPLLFAAQIASALWIAWTVHQAQAIRDLIRDRKTRILHGLEHATIKLLERRGLVVRSGCTYAGFFVLDVDHDGRWWERVDDVRAAAGDAIRSILAGERALAYDPRCGTSRLVAAMLVAVAICGVGLAALVFGLPTSAVTVTTIATLVAAGLLAKPLGLWAQHAWTVSTALAAARVTEVSRRALADASGLQLFVTIDVIPQQPAGPAAAISPFGG